MTGLHKFAHVKRSLFSILKWSALSILMGVIGGVLGAVFHHVLQFVTDLRLANNWLIFLLPVGGLTIVGLYRLLRLQSNRGTNEIILSVQENKAVSPLVAPGIFLATAITHLFGGSAGREGAALQLGGATASFLGRLFRLDEEERSVMVVCGMSAVFAGLFGTPLTAGLFVLEFVSVGTIFSPALLPSFLSAVVASKVSHAMGGHVVTAIQEQTIGFTLGNSWKILLLAVLISLLGIALCHVFHKAEHLAHKGIKSPFLRIAVGGVVIAALTLLVGDHRFNGAGMEMALEAIEGSVDWYAFAVKLLFTAITLAAGFKGGEIVPTFCIGATFGCVVGQIVGLDPSFAATLGLIGLFCAVTNSPLASIALSIEMFGTANLYMFVLICVITFALSGNSSLYASQIMVFSKNSMKRMRASEENTNKTM